MVHKGSTLSWQVQPLGNGLGNGYVHDSEMGTCTTRETDLRKKGENGYRLRTINKEVPRGADRHFERDWDRPCYSRKKKIK